MTRTIDNRKIDIPALSIIGSFTVLALLLVSWDSYLYDLWKHHDVIWFYMCGKAWMNGMTPYVDFADSKGPLLWLFYGIGYLLSPRDYIGVYWVSCVLYTIIFYQCYKCARLFVDDRRLALMAVLLSSLFFLSGLTHIEVRAEDYCYAFMLPVFYRFLRFNVSRENSYRFARQSALMLGFALGATLLIKYSCTLMLAVFIPYFAIIVPRRCGYSPWRAVAGMAVAGVVTLLPMLVLLWAQGALVPFLQEYFGVTGATFSNMHGQEITVHRFLGLFMGVRAVVFTVAVALGVIIYCFSIRDGWSMAVVAFVWFIAVIMLNGTDVIYLNVLSLFTVLFAGIVVSSMGRWLRSWILDVVLAVGVLAALFALVTGHESLFNRPTLDQKIWYYYPALMSQYESPRVLYLLRHDHGEGVPVNALPACKYWSLQEGHTEEMVRDQIKAVLSKQANVVFVNSNETDMIKLLQGAGYYRNDFVDAGLGDETWVTRPLMFSDKPLKASRLPVPSPTDVLLKRNVVVSQK